MTTWPPEKLATLLGIWCAFLACTVGCGEHPHLAPVHGTITLDGKPIGPGDILFIPSIVDGTKGKTASGSFDTDGQYSLSTYQEGDGALVGDHKVVITPRRVGVEPGGETATLAKLPPIPPRYGRASQSQLSATVHEKTNTIDFSLTTHSK